MCLVKHHQHDAQGIHRTVLDVVVEGLRRAEEKPASACTRQGTSLCTRATTRSSTWGQPDSCGRASDRATSNMSSLMHTVTARTSLTSTAPPGHWGAHSQEVERLLTLGFPQPRGKPSPAGSPGASWGPKTRFGHPETTWISSTEAMEAAVVQRGRCHPQPFAATLPATANSMQGRSIQR